MLVVAAAPPVPAQPARPRKPTAMAELVMRRQVLRLPEVRAVRVRCALVMVGP
jgi:hypothetical protein